MAARRKSERTTLPRATNFRGVESFRLAGQLIAISTVRPGMSVCSVVKSIPALEILTVAPPPCSLALFLLITLYRSSLSMGKRLATLRSLDFLVAFTTYLLPLPVILITFIFGPQLFADNGKKIAIWA
jgi:hypothetical protein